MFLGTLPGALQRTYLDSDLVGWSECWNWLQDLSLYTAVTPQQALEQGGLPLPELLVLLVIAVLTATGAIALFERRSIT